MEVFRHKIASLFPHADIKNIKLFYVMTFFTNGWFINANWIFLALLFMNKFELGIIDGIAFGIGTLVDLPSGALADLIGRKKTIIIARSIFALSCLLFIFSFDLWSFAFANVLFFIGTSFYAGADTALLYDSLKQAKQESHYLQVSSRNELIMRIMIFVSSLIGAYAFTLNMRYPFVLLFVFSLFALLTAFRLEEVHVEKKRIFNLRQFLRQQYEGIRILVGPRIRPYFSLFLVIFGIYVMFGWGVLRGYIAIDYGFGGSDLSVIFGTIALVVGFLGLLLPRLVARSSDYKMILILSLIFAFSFLLVGLFMGSKVWGILILFILSLTGAMVQILSQKIVHDEIPSNMRATTQSALSIISKLPYVIGAYFIGSYAQSNSLPAFAKILFAICVGAILLSVFFKKIFPSVNK